MAGAKTLFVTGTDTGCGKTTAACALLRAARRQGVRAVGWKPVASGCVPTREGLRNEDALALERAAQSGEPYELLNPVALEPAVAPHLAARAANRRIDGAELLRAHAQLAQRHALIVAEGAGGWRVPLDGAGTLGSWVGAQRWPVLLVVGMRLGCLSHALLSAEAIARETTLAGWVASVLAPPMELLEENFAELSERLPAPCWGRLDGTDAEFSGATIRAMLARL